MKLHDLSLQLWLRERFQEVAIQEVFLKSVGVFFWWLRDRSQSLLAPMALHWSTNALGYLFAYAAWNL